MKFEEWVVQRMENLSRSFWKVPGPPVKEEIEFLRNWGAEYVYSPQRIFSIGDQREIRIWAKRNKIDLRIDGLYAYFRNRNDLMIFKLTWQ